MVGTAEVPRSASPEVGERSTVIAGSRANIDTVREIVRKVAPGLHVKRALQRAHEYHLDIVD